MNNQPACFTVLLFAVVMLVTVNWQIHCVHATNTIMASSATQRFTKYEVSAAVTDAVCKNETVAKIEIENQAFTNTTLVVDGRYRFLTTSTGHVEIACTAGGSTTARFAPSSISVLVVVRANTFNNGGIFIDGFSVAKFKNAMLFIESNIIRPMNITPVFPLPKEHTTYSSEYHSYQQNPHSEVRSVIGIYMTGVVMNGTNQSIRISQNGIYNEVRGLSGDLVVDRQWGVLWSGTGIRSMLWQGATVTMSQNNVVLHDAEDFRTGFAWTTSVSAYDGAQIYVADNKVTGNEMTAVRAVRTSAVTFYNLFLRAGFHIERNILRDPSSATHDRSAFVLRLQSGGGIREPAYLRVMNNTISVAVAMPYSAVVGLDKGSLTNKPGNIVLTIADNIVNAPGRIGHGFDLISAVDPTTNFLAQVLLVRCNILIAKNDVGSPVTLNPGTGAKKLVSSCANDNGCDRDVDCGPAVVFEDLVKYSLQHGRCECSCNESQASLNNVFEVSGVERVALHSCFPIPQFTTVNGFLNALPPQPPTTLSPTYAPTPAPVITTTEVPTTSTPITDAPSTIPPTPQPSTNRNVTATIPIDDVSEKNVSRTLTIVETQSPTSPNGTTPLEYDEPLPDGKYKVLFQIAFSAEDVSIIYKQRQQIRTHIASIMNISAQDVEFLGLFHGSAIARMSVRSTLRSGPVRDKLGDDSSLQSEYGAQPDSMVMVPNCKRACNMTGTESADPSEDGSVCVCTCKGQYTGRVCDTCPVEYSGSSCDQCAPGLNGTYPNCVSCKPLVRPKDDLHLNVSLLCISALGGSETMSSITKSCEAKRCECLGGVPDSGSSGTCNMLFQLPAKKRRCAEFLCDGAYRECLHSKQSSAFTNGTVDGDAQSCAKEAAFANLDISHTRSWCEVDTCDSTYDACSGELLKAACAAGVTEAMSFSGAAQQRCWNVSTLVALLVGLFFTILS